MQIAQRIPADWTVFRQLRLAALADAPHAFDSFVPTGNMQPIRPGEPAMEAQMRMALHRAAI